MATITEDREQAAGLIKYRLSTRILHWVNAAAFLTLFLTGLVLFLPPLGFLAAGGITRQIHRAAALVFVIAPLLYLSLNWQSAWEGIIKAFRWDKYDIRWLRAAPRYYFVGDDDGLPAQSDTDTGQKVWLFLTTMSGVLFTVTGFVMWALKTTAPADLLQWSLFAHDVAFIVMSAMLFVRIYLGVRRPRSQSQKATP